MSTLYSQKDSNIQKTFFLMAGFLTIVIGIGYVVSWFLGDPIIVYVAIGLALITNIGSYWFSDKLVLSMTNAKQITKADAPEFYNIVENLSITAGLPMPKVYIVNDPNPNAFATGRDPEHAAVAATTGILKLLNKTELEGVMAHELAHVGNRDILVMTVAVVLAGFVAIISDFFSRAILYGGGNGRDGKNPLFLILGLIGIILAPFAAKLIQLAVSRRREYLADASGALLTRYPEGLASALEKISAPGHPPMKTASNATAHLFISNPFGNQKKSSFMEKMNNLFSTHPPAEDRIRILRQMDK